MSTRQLEAAYGTIHQERVKSTAEPQWPYFDQIRIIQASDEVSCCGSNFQLHVSVIFLSLFVGKGCVTCGGVSALLSEGHALLTQGTRSYHRARRIVPCIIRDLPIIVLNESVQIATLLVLQNIYHMKSAGHLYWQLSPQWDSR